jgi:AmiR/NasT family two-component response regulator
LVPRADIDQAKGVLRAQYGCTADGAFRKLVEQSQRRNIKDHTIAKEMFDPQL